MLKNSLFLSRRTATTTELLSLGLAEEKQPEGDQ